MSGAAVHPDLVLGILVNRHHDVFVGAVVGEYEVGSRLRWGDNAAKDLVDHVRDADAKRDQVAREAADSDADLAIDRHAFRG